MYQHSEPFLYEIMAGLREEDLKRRAERESRRRAVAVPSSAGRQGRPALLGRLWRPHSAGMLTISLPATLTSSTCEVALKTAPSTSSPCPSSSLSSTNPKPKPK